VIKLHLKEQLVPNSLIHNRAPLAMYLPLPILSANLIIYRSICLV
jgi:hypothetical protein